VVSLHAVKVTLGAGASPTLTASKPLISPRDSSPGVMRVFKASKTQKSKDESSSLYLSSRMSEDHL
jgi:hypothetical protein